MGVLTYPVPSEWDGRRTQDFLRQGCGLSWRMVVRLRNMAGGVTVDGKTRRTIDPVHTGETVLLTLPEDNGRGNAFFPLIQIENCPDHVIAFLLGFREPCAGEENHGEGLNIVWFDSSVNFQIHFFGCFSTSESMGMVTGPSLTKSSIMCAPN